MPLSGRRGGPPHPDPSASSGSPLSCFRRGALVTRRKYSDFILKTALPAEPPFDKLRMVRTLLLTTFLTEPGAVNTLRYPTEEIALRHCSGQCLERNVGSYRLSTSLTRPEARSKVVCALYSSCQFSHLNIPYFRIECSSEETQAFYKVCVSFLQSHATTNGGAWSGTK